MRGARHGVRAAAASAGLVARRGRHQWRAAVPQRGYPRAGRVCATESSACRRSAPCICSRRRARNSTISPTVRSANGFAQISGFTYLGDGDWLEVQLRDHGPGNLARAACDIVSTTWHSPTDGACNWLMRRARLLADPVSSALVLRTPCASDCDGRAIRARPLHAGCRTHDECPTMKHLIVIGLSVARACRLRPLRERRVPRDAVPKQRSRVAISAPRWSNS